MSHIPVPRPRVRRPPARPGQGVMKQLGGAAVRVVRQQRTRQVPKAGPTLNIQRETPRSMMQSTKSAWNGTSRQIDQLLDLQYPDNSPIITLDRKDIMIEIVGLLASNGFDFTLRFLESAPDPDYILWNQPSMDESHNKVIYEHFIQRTEEKGIKGVGKCRYCASSDGLVYATKQTRSGDEAATIFVRCSQCKKQWRE